MKKQTNRQKTKKQQTNKKAILEVNKKYQLKKRTKTNN